MKKRNNNSFDRAKSAAFTGHRYYDFSRKEIIRQRLSRAIVEAYDNGIRNFISGFATGIDLMAAQTVQSLSLRNKGCKSSICEIYTLFYTQECKIGCFCIF